MQFPFSKMHGAGNDFVVLEDRNGAFPLDDNALIRRINAPRFGIASEGMLVLRPGASRKNAPPTPSDAGRSSFRMVFFNPDGSRASMCGNGARCAAFYAFLAGFAPRNMRFDTDAGPVEARISPGETAFAATVAVRTSDVAGAAYMPEADAWLLDTGVPHAVRFVENAAAIDIAADGPALRRHRAFGDAGANADFVEVVDASTLRLRTWERGVEAETGACGTGAVAAAVAAAVCRQVCRFPVAVHVSSGATLSVDCDAPAPPSGAAGLRLTGPAQLVFRGVLDTEAFPA